jgi:hypothetical protein
MRNKNKKPSGTEMRDEYDFSGGVRGKYFREVQAGYTVAIRQEDGTALVKEAQPEGMVLLEPDVRQYFPDSESVNRTLRSLITLGPMRKTSKSRTRKKD